MKDIEKSPVCVKTECFAYKDGHCIILTNNNFKGRECPFFKTAKQAEKKQAMYKKGI